MKNSTKVILIFLGLVLIIIGIVIWQVIKPETNETARVTVAQPQTTPSPGEKDKPATQYPINPIANEQTTTDTLPALPVSDTAIRNALANLLNEKTVLQFFYSTEIIRRLVVTIDNLPRENVSAQLLPLKPVGGQFIVKENDTALYLDPSNYKRYTPYVELIQNLDTSKLVALYRYFYPLFQQQYQEIGYPDGYFNDRLIAVIDDMINTPEISEPVQLVQKHVLYQYVDPDIEDMSAGGKLLIRMGHDNAAKVKDKLREIRSKLIN